MNDSLFSKIIRGESPAHRVWEDDQFLAILDIRPIHAGHVLLIPKQPVDNVFELEQGVYEALWRRIRELARPLQTASGAVRIGIAVEGFGVPHAHVHLVPLFEPGDLDANKQHEVSAVELAAMAQRIREVISRWPDGLSE